MLVLVKQVNGEYKIFAEGDTVLQVNRELTKLYDEVMKKRQQLK